MAHTSLKPLNNRELSTFCSQMAMMLSAGISAMESVSILREGLEDPGAQEILAQVSHSLEAGESLSAALSAPAGAFPRYFLDMVDMGEKAGQLDTVFSSLAASYERRHIFGPEYPQRRSLSAGNDRHDAGSNPGADYPGYAHLPPGVRPAGHRNESFFRRGPKPGHMAQPLQPGHSGSGSSRSFGAAGFDLYKRRRRRLSAAGRHLPGIRKIAESTALSRFADGMAVTLRSGLDTDESLELAGRLTESPELRQKIEACRQQTAHGTDLGTAFQENHIFSGLCGKMVSVGILSGSLDTVMAQVAEQYAEDASQRLSQAVARLEPTLVAVLSVLVGLILLSVMLPLMGIMSNIG